MSAADFSRFMWNEAYGKFDKDKNGKISEQERGSTKMEVDSYEAFLPWIEKNEDLFLKQAIGNTKDEKKEFVMLGLQKVKRSFG